MMMKRFVFPALIVLMLTPAAHAIDPHAMLEEIDALRLPPYPNVRLTLHLIDYDDGSMNVYNYEALMRTGAGSLVFALDGDQRGQKYLAANDNYWLYAPNTHRAIRLTPLQAIRGQASIGDISRLRFADDYSATLSDKPNRKIDGRTFIVLDLHAKSQSATYASITLYVAETSGAPIEADMMAASGRKLKTLEFGPVAEADGRDTISQVTYIDAFDTKRKTVVQLTSVERAETPIRDFRPEALPLISE